MSQSFSLSLCFKWLIMGLAISFTTVSAQDRTTEAGEAEILNPDSECTPYSFSLVNDNAAKFPAIWEQASIVSGDTVASALFASINATLPAIAPKGTAPGSNTGDFSGFDYASDDPDCWWTFSQCTTSKLSGIPPDIASIPEPKSLGYGFDDGPNCSHNAFYDYLAENNQKASLFYIGSNVMDWPLEAQRGIVDEHEICVHTWSHEYMTSLTNEAAFAELYYTREAIKLITGVTPTCWRPPFGDVDDRIRSIAKALNLTTYIWGYDSFDWEQAEGLATAAQVDANYQTMITDLNAGKFDTIGAIILTHELNNFTMSEAVAWHKNLSAVFNLVPVGVALNKSQPYVETNYSLPSFAEYIAGTVTVSAGASASSTSASGSTASAGSSSGTDSGSTSSNSVPTSNSKTTSSAPRLTIGFTTFTLLSAAVVSIGFW